MQDTGKMRWVDGLIFFGPVLCLEANRHEAKKIINHCLVKGYPFSCKQDGGDVLVFVRESFDLKQLDLRTTAKYRVVTE